MTNEAAECRQSGRYCHFDWPILDHYKLCPTGFMIKRVSSKIAFDHNQDTTFSFSLVFLASEAARPRQKVNFITWLRVRLYNSAISWPGLYNRFMRHFRLFTLARVVLGPLIPVLASHWSTAVIPAYDWPRLSPLSPLTPTRDKQ